MFLFLYNVFFFSVSSVVDRASGQFYIAIPTPTNVVLLHSLHFCISIVYCQFQLSKSFHKSIDQFNSSSSPPKSLLISALLNFSISTWLLSTSLSYIFKYFLSAETWFILSLTYLFYCLLFVHLYVHIST